jgi:hypothetical protein
LYFNKDNFFKNLESYLQFNFGKRALIVSYPAAKIYPEEITPLLPAISGEKITEDQTCFFLQILLKYMVIQVRRKIIAISVMGLFSVERKTNVASFFSVGSSFLKKIFFGVILCDISLNRVCTIVRSLPQDQA